MPYGIDAREVNYYIEDLDTAAQWCAEVGHQDWNVQSTRLNFILSPSLEHASFLLLLSPDTWKAEESIMERWTENVADIWTLCPTGREQEAFAACD